MSSDLFSLQGRVALITGSARGIGWGMAQTVAAAGAHVVINDLDEATIAARAAELKARGLSASHVAFDVTDEAGVNAGVGRIIAEHGGSIEVDGGRYQPGQMLLFSAGTKATVQASEDARLMLFGGEPVGPRHIWWNFVSSRKDRIEQAKADWLAGRIPLPSMDNQEFIPLPETPKPAGPEPMS